MKIIFCLVLILISFANCSVPQEKNNTEVLSDNFSKSLENKNIIEVYEIASALYDQRVNDKAIIAFQKCIDNNYNIDTAYFKQGACYVDLLQPEIGVEKFEKVLSINPKYYKACFNIGAISYDNREYEKSIAYYQKALQLDSTVAKVYYGIAASQFVLQRFNEAEINCQLSLKLDPKDENANTLWSWLHEKDE